MKSSWLTASLWARTYSKLLVDSGLLLKATEGEITWIKAAPLCSIAALISGTSWALSPEKLRATSDAPSCSAKATRSIGESVLTGPRRAFEPLSAVAENWPLVRPYTPLFSTMETMSTARRLEWGDLAGPVEAEASSAETPTWNRR